mmetsp:Transcript_62530/g.146646  ORF Transcript_62530/g.146646 Transcript_62530/m.146646 type:complete len:517 (-) Transcript_62530:102-1652(-)
MRLFGIPKRQAEDGEPLEADVQEQEQESVRSAHSGSQSSNGGDRSFGQMKLVIKNTFIGGYEESADDDPPKTLARSASDSKLDCQSSASSVLFWYPQRGGGSMSRSNSSVMSRSDADELDDGELIEHGPAGPHHIVYGRRKPAEGPKKDGRSAAQEPWPPTEGYYPQLPMCDAQATSLDMLSKMPNQMPSPGSMDVPRDGLPSMEPSMRRPPGNFATPSLTRPPGIFDGSPQQNGHNNFEQNRLNLNQIRPGNFGVGDRKVAAPFPANEPDEQNLLDFQILKMQAELAELTAQRRAAGAATSTLTQKRPGDLAELQLRQQMQNLSMQTGSDPSFHQMPNVSSKLDFNAQANSTQADANPSILPSGLPNQSAPGSQMVQQQLHQQVLESQMQQLQLQQQMQQLQLQTQRLQQQLTGQPAAIPQPSEEDALLAQIPFNDEGERASLGSRLHPDNCSPCIFWFKDKTFCNKGIMCDFCHFRHPGQKNKRIRPSKNTRLQMRAAQARAAGGDVPVAGLAA